MADHEPIIRSAVSDPFAMRDPLGARWAAREVERIADTMTADDLAWWVISTWHSADESTLGRDRWIALFRRAGYTDEGRLTPLPAEPLTLYRGAEAHRADGLSWSTRRGVARQFATAGGQRSARGRLYVVECPPDRLLARWHGRGEWEVVADVAGLDVRAYSEAAYVTLDQGLGRRRADPLGEAGHRAGSGVDRLFG